MNPFDEIEQHYPEVIDAMPKRFNSHQFILKLAHRYQGLYIKVLAQYVNNDAPFKVTHSQLASRLNNYDTLIKQDIRESSKNIFGEDSDAMTWIKK